MEDPFIQELLELMLPPSRGYRPHTTSRFASTSRPPGSTNPHRGLDANYYLGPKANPQSGLNLDHPTIRSPVAGDIEEIEPSLGRIVIREKDPAGNYTGYRVEILHTNTRSVERTDPVSVRQPIATMGGVGVNGKGKPEGFQHMHVQVIDPAGNVVNPLRHLFEYHHPGEPIPPLPQFEPQQLGPRAQRNSADQSGNQGQLAPSGAPAPNDAPAGAMSTQLSPGTPIPGATGPTVIGGPGPLRPLVPPANSRSPAPYTPTAPAPDGLPPLHFAPETPRRVGPFEAPGLFRSDAFGSPRVAPAADGTRTNPSVLPTPAFGASGVSAPATSPAASGSAGQIGDGNGIDDWRKGLSPAASSNFDPSSFRGLPSPMPGIMPVDPNQSSQAADAPLGMAGGAPGVSAPTLSPDASGSARLLSTGNPVLDWWNGLVADVDAVSRRPGFGGLNTPMLGGVPTPPTQPRFDSGLPGLLARFGAFDPPAGGLLGLLQEHMRNNPNDNDVSA